MAGKLLQAYAAFVRDEHGSGWRAKLSLASKQPSGYPKKLSSAYVSSKTSLRKRYFITVQQRVYSQRLHVPAPEHRCVGCTNCPHQPFFRSQPYRKADRVRDCDACDRRSNPLPRAMTAIVLKISPRPHYGDDELRAGAAWRGWCCLLAACDIQLGFMMRCAYSHVIAKLEERADPPVLKRLHLAHSRHVWQRSSGGECRKYDDVTR